MIFVAWDVARPGRRPATGSSRSLLDEPLTERRRRLEALDLPLASDGGGFALSYLASVDSVDGLEAAFAQARARRNEGLMVKDPQSRYSPGRRGLGWLKMKKALATIDCVVVGVEVGHGKRHGVLSDYTFAVRDEATGNLVTIGKAYSGLTDAEIAEMTRWFEAHTIATLRPLPAGRADGRGRGRLRRDHAVRRATSRASPCGSRASRACAPTSPRTRSTPWPR